MEGDDAVDSIEVERPVFEAAPRSERVVPSPPQSSMSLAEKMRRDSNDYTESRNKFEETCSELIEAAKGQQAINAELQQVIKERNQVIQEQAKTIQHRVDTIAQKLAYAEGQEAFIKRQMTTISQMQNQLKRLEQRSRRDQDGTRVIEGRKFIALLPPNDALFVCKNPNLTIDNIENSKTTVFSKFKCIQLGGQLQDSVVMDGVSFKRIEGGRNHGKLVQDLGQHSVFESESGSYIRWRVRTKEDAQI